MFWMTFVQQCGSGWFFKSLHLKKAKFKPDSSRFSPKAFWKTWLKLSFGIFSSNPRIGFINSWLPFIGWSNNWWIGNTNRWNRVWQIWNFWQILWSTKIMAWIWIDLCHSFFCIYFYRKSVWKKPFYWFYFRWLKIKEIYTAISISLTLFLNHLK